MSSDYPMVAAAAIIAARGAAVYWVA